jgi:hypothetical protein
MKTFVPLTPYQAPLRILDIPPSHEHEMVQYIRSHSPNLYPDRPELTEVCFLIVGRTAMAYRIHDHTHASTMQVPGLIFAIFNNQSRKGSYQIDYGEIRESFTITESGIHEYIVCDVDDDIEIVPDFSFPVSEIVESATAKAKEFQSFLKDLHYSELSTDRKSGNRAILILIAVAILAAATSYHIFKFDKAARLSIEYEQQRELFNSLQREVSQRTHVLTGSLSRDEVSGMVSKLPTYSFYSILNEIYLAEPGRRSIQAISADGGRIQISLRGKDPLAFQQRLIQTGAFQSVEIQRISSADGMERDFSIVLVPSPLGLVDY